MQRVLAHIDAHLDAPLDLDALAAVANFSPFHFHRVFAAWTGETCGEYLRRRRVETAALRLLTAPRQGLLAVALCVGFGSAEALSRAFRAHFGCPPGLWRAQRQRAGQPAGAHSKSGQALRKRGQAARENARQDQRSFHHLSEVTMQVHIIERPPVVLACLPYTGPHGPALGEFWLHTVRPWLLAHDLGSQPRYGISLDHPGITAPEHCRYEAGVELPPQRALPADAIRRELPGGRHAECPFRGTARDIGEAWDRLLRDWLPASGYEICAKPLEYYPADASFDPATGAFSCSILLPIRPV